MSELKNTFEFFKNQLDNISNYTAFVDALRADGYDLKPSNTGHLAGVSTRAANAIVQDLEDAITPTFALEAGKTYKTRSGELVDIIADVSKYKRDKFSFIGIGHADGIVITYRKDGSYLQSGEASDDLIAEHTEPAQEQEPTEPKPFEVGDEVCCAGYGNGAVSKSKNGSAWPVCVKFQHLDTDAQYTDDGKPVSGCLAATLRHGHNSWPHIADLQK